jgi:hypothetical protein
MTNFKYYSETPSVIQDIDTEEYYQVYTDPFADLEFTVTKLFWKNRLTVVLGGRNLMNNYERRTYGYRGDQDAFLSPINYGRTFFLRVNLQLSN